MRVLPNVIVRRPSAPHEDAPNTHKENAVNAAPAPVYFSTKPGGPPLVMPVGDVPPLQGSKFRGVLTVRNVEPPGAVTINTCHKSIFCPEICPEIQEAPGAAATKTGHTVEPLNLRCVDYFCPEIQNPSNPGPVPHPPGVQKHAEYAPALQIIKPGASCLERENAEGKSTLPDSGLTSTEILQELTELNTLLEGSTSVSDAPDSLPDGMKHNSSMRLQIQDLTFQERIGEMGGQSGGVFSALYRDPDTQTQHRVAVKKIPIVSSASAKQLASIDREAHVMTLVSSRCHHSVRYWGWCQDNDGTICLVMKRYEQSLHSKLDMFPHRKMPLKQVKRYGKQIAQALTELHSQNILFLDLKPSNILLDEFDNIVVCDFGISLICRSGSQEEVGMHGTAHYMSPEAFDQETFGSISSKSDVWSFACCLVEMVTGERPWNGTSIAAICYKVASKMEIPDIPRDFPDSVQQLLRGCFDHNSSLRPSFPEICQVFDQDWKVDGLAKDLPEVSIITSGADAYCTKTLDEETNKNENRPAQVFCNAPREVKKQPDSKHVSEHLSHPAQMQERKFSAFKGETVRLMTYDKKIVEIPVAVAERSCTLCRQAHLQEQGQVIALNDPNCRLKIISKVITYLRTLLDVECGRQHATELRKVEAMLTQVDDEDIFTLLMVANYLDLPELTYLACAGLKAQPNPPLEAKSGQNVKSCRDHVIVPVASIAGALNVALGPTSGTDRGNDKANRGGKVSASEKGAQARKPLPELPSQRHRSDQAGPRPTRSRSSPAKPHQIDDGILYTTDKVLSENDMKNLIPPSASPQRLPLKDNFLPGVGFLESLTEWGSSSWTDLVDPRVAHAGRPPSPGRGTKRNRSGSCDEVAPIAPKRMATKNRDAYLKGTPQVLTQLKCADISIHCTPFVGGAAKASSSDEPLSNSTNLTFEKGTLPGTGLPTDPEPLLNRLQFRRLVDPEGDCYVGTCKGDLMHGIGVCWYANGDKYHGQWRAGMRHGIGRMEWNDGHIFEGSWRQDMVCPGAKSKRKPTDKLSEVVDQVSPHPLPYRPPMSVQMFRARLDRMQGENEEPMDPLAGIFIDAKSQESNANVKDTRGILTRVVDQTHSVAGMFTGVGEFVMDLMSQSPPAANSLKSSESEASPRRLRCYRVEQDKLVLEEYCSSSNTLSGAVSPSNGHQRPLNLFYLF